MAEGQFLMQRYYGSDEESNEIKDSSLIEENVIDTYSPKKKKSACDTFSNKKNNHEDNFVSPNGIENVSFENSNNEYATYSFIKKHSKNKLTQNSLTSDSNDETKDKTELKSKKKSLKRKQKVNDKNISFEQQIVLKEKLKKENKHSKNKDSVENNNLTETENFLIIGQKLSKVDEKIKPNLPKWLSNPTIIGIDLKDKEVPVQELEYLDKNSKNNLSDTGIDFLFPVQQAVIPWLLQVNQYSLINRPFDLCVSAPTGSGKTLAFVLPIVQSLKNRVVCEVRALIALPVSELAVQVYKVFETFVRGTDLKVVLLTGQKSFTAEQNALVRHGLNRPLSLADIVVTTPGRILDHIHRTKGFTLKHLRYLVIDEADRMMEEIQKGWLKQIEDFVYKDCQVSGCVCFTDIGGRMSSHPVNACQFGYASPPLQKLLYSATLSHDPEKLHTLSLYRPKLFVTQDESDSTEWIGKCVIPEELRLQHIVCDAETKPLVLCYYIKKYGFKKVLCFTDSIERSQRLNFVLEGMGILESREVSSNYRPVQRKIVLDQFRSGKVNIIVCSDLVARGIDIEGIDCVVSYDSPPFLKTFIHRIGRTGRAGKTGTAVTLLTENEFPNFKKMLTSAGISLPTEVTVSTSELTEYVEPFQRALKTVDAKLKKFKTNKRGKKRKKKVEGVEKGEKRLR